MPVGSHAQVATPEQRPRTHTAEHVQHRALNVDPEASERVSRRCLPACRLCRSVVGCPALHLGSGAAQRSPARRKAASCCCLCPCTYRRSESHGLMSFLLVLILAVLVVLVLLLLRLCML